MKKTEKQLIQDGYHRVFEGNIQEGDFLNCNDEYIINEGFLLKQVQTTGCKIEAGDCVYRKGTTQITLNQINPKIDWYSEEASTFVLGDKLAIGRYKYNFCAHNNGDPNVFLAMPVCYIGNYCAFKTIEECKAYIETRYKEWLLNHIQGK